MISHDLVERWDFAMMPPPMGGERDPVDDVTNTIELAEQRAFETLVDECVADQDDPELPPIVIRDEAGRPFTGVRLEREPGATCFTIVLTTAEQEAS